MKQNGYLGKFFAFLILVVAIIYFIGFISFHPESLFLKKVLYNVPYEYEFYFEVLLWIFF
jgi:hypothetical protein